MPWFKGVLEEIEAKGAIGILSGSFKNTTVGLVAAIVLGVIMALVLIPRARALRSFGKVR